MDKKDASAILEERGVKPTPNRILVLSTLLEADHPMSLLDIDTYIETMDKSSIFRVLTLFHSNHIVHAIEDGSNSLKYEVCRGHGHCSTDDLHVHFYCETCHSTYCFPQTHIPRVEMPAGFVADSINYMIKGTCDKCSKKHVE